MKSSILVSALVCAGLLGGASCRPNLPGDLPSLMQLMGSNDMGVNFDAARRVDKLYGKAGLLEALKQSNANTRAVAAHFLMNHPEPDVQAALLAATRDPDDYVRMWATLSLGKIGDREVLSRVKSLTADSSELVSTMAKEALEELNSRWGGGANSPK